MGRKTAALALLQELVTKLDDMECASGPDGSEGTRWEGWYLAPNLGRALIDRARALTRSLPCHVRLMVPYCFTAAKKDPMTTRPGEVVRLVAIYPENPLCRYELDLPGYDPVFLSEAEFTSVVRFEDDNYWAIAHSQLSGNHHPDGLFGIYQDELADAQQKERFQRLACPPF